MEEISSRRSSNEEFFGSSLMEPTVHDVMSLELSHHSSEDNYLDPTSFGDGGSFDEFSTGPQVETSRYESHGYDQSIRSHHYQGPLPPPGSRFDHHTSHPPMRSGVPTYPVKTVDPSTCAPFAPARMTFRVKPPRIRHNGRPKKEPMDPKTVEDEVARNVSQILSATKQQKLAQEAQQRCGIVTPITRINFSCSDCGKAMTSHRNLQRHRQTSCCRKVGEWVDRSQSWPSQWAEKDPLSEDGDSLQGLNSSFSFSSDGWCSPNRSYSPSAVGSIDMASMLPLSLDTDDSRTHSSSASHCSNSSNGKGAQETFMCDSCKKTVCSLRSLKRHHTTCKQYVAEYGPPLDLDVVPVKRIRSARRVKVPKYKETSSTSSDSTSPEQIDDSSDLPPLRVPADSSTQNEDDRAPKQIPAINTCADCNRQLCSASNLKRHRATCKAALTRGESSHSSTSTGTPTYTSHLPELPARDRNIIDRSYAAAVAASAQKAMIAQGRQDEEKEENHQYTAFIVSALSQTPKSQNWVTVGEHLRAKHILQTKTETKDELPQEAVLIQNTPPPGAPVHNQVLEIRRPSLVEKEGGNEERPLSHRNESTVYKICSPLDPKSRTDSTEIPPLESIITTQPLSGDRVTGVPLLVHDSRNYLGNPNKVSREKDRENLEFQCPECKKTYSCRKNVKRHRMAVHKLSSDDISRYPGPIPCPHAILGDLSQLSPSLPKILLPSKIDGKLEFKRETITLSPTLLDKGFSQDASWQSLDYMEEDEREESARIAADLKRKIELNNSMAEEKNSRPELAEADTTFSEDNNDFHNGSHHSSPGVVSSSGPLPSLASWVGSKPLSVEIPYSGTRSAGHSPLFKSRRLDYDFPSGFLLNDDVPLDPMLGHGPSSAPRTFDDEDGMWFKTEEMPDSTTNHRSTSPCALLETPQLGTLPYTRKRALSGGSNSTNQSAINDPKQARHSCQDCGKFYSSEWNLERHKKENCPSKSSGAVSPVSTLTSSSQEDVSILMGSCRFVLPKSALIKASGAFSSLFQIHDPNKGELRLDGDPMDFQNLLDVYNDPVNLNRINVDNVLNLAEQYKFGQVTDSCSKFISEELFKASLMHAIRLADQYKLLSVKQRLFSSISIEVFRSLNSDRDYQMMSSELKAELLEKWGTFL